MSIETTQDDTLDTPNYQAEANNTLKAIEQHLKSIRSMLSFFTFLVILALIIQGCSVLMSF